MLAQQLKNYLESVPDEVNVYVFVGKTGETRHLRFSDLDRSHDGDIVIDAEYALPKPKGEVEGCA